MTDRTSATNLAQLMRTRRTIGAFRPDLPPQQWLRDAIEVACWAPNHRKTEPWRFHVLGPRTAAAIVDLNAELVAEKKGAAAAEQKRSQWSKVPGWLVVTCLKSPDAFQQEEDYAACCCAIQNLTLALWERGIGTKWSTGDVTRHPGFFELLGISSDEHRMVGLVWYGFPEVVPQQTRLPVDAVTRELP